uniref:Uncharacterized protein n=1 Tax=Oryza punctata TaxID=4537 RepID=A0A0E0MNM0_ORYPU
MGRAGKFHGRKPGQLVKAVEQAEVRDEAKKLILVAIAGTTLLQKPITLKQQPVPSQKFRWAVLPYR